MVQNKEIIWDKYVAVTTAIIAVLAAIATLQAGANVSEMLLQKNNANLYQNQANKEWNTYLAQELVSLHENTSAGNIQAQKQAQLDLQDKTNALESKVSMATEKAQFYSARSNDLAVAGTLLDIAIALSAMSVLIRKKSFWLFSLLLAGVGVYFLTLGFI